jgi:hypothetical protein
LGLIGLIIFVEANSTHQLHHAARALEVPDAVVLRLDCSVYGPRAAALVGSQAHDGVRTPYIPKL